MQKKYRIFDTHAHYDDERYKKDLDEVIKQGTKEGVEKIINASFDIKSSKEAIKLSAKYDNIYYAIGIHPESASNVTSTDVEELEKIIQEKSTDKKFVAIGEIGLDYYYTKENKEDQKKLFNKQLKIAQKYKKPIVIHCRDAAEDMYNIIKSEEYRDNKIAFHCFQPSELLTKLIIERKYMIGIGGNITYNRNEKSLEIIKKIPVSQMLFETDAPYLSPVPQRGKRNESRYIKHVIEKVAEIKQIDSEGLAKRVYKNSINFFGV
ncbi:MAG: TatD family hydrolase [Clostridia bacterium]|nr:TatD family hydrolase [Clostridia bacterium]MDD4375231.1 TatD family hydrolase [Clostridia bacterium]